MIKHNKVQRRRLNFFNTSFLIFFVCACVWIVSSILLKNEQVNLQVAIQNTNESIAQLDHINESLALDVQELANFARVANIAKDQGLQAYQTNVIALDNGE